MRGAGGAATDGPLSRWHTVPGAATAGRRTGPSCTSCSLSQVLKLCCRVPGRIVVFVKDCSGTLLSLRQVESEEDVMWTADQRETAEEITARGYRFLQWLIEVHKLLSPAPFGSCHAMPRRADCFRESLSAPRWRMRVRHGWNSV